MRIAFVASLCVAVFACGQGGSLSGNTGRKTADSRGSRGSDDTSQTPQNQPVVASEETGGSGDPDDTNNEESRVVAPEVITGAYLTCGAAQSAAKPQPEGIRYFGCIAVDANKQRIDLKNVKVQYILRDLKGVALDVPTVDLPDVDQDVVWAVPQDVYTAGISPEAAFPGASDYLEAPKTIHRKCFMKTVAGGVTQEQEAACNVAL